MLEKLGFRLWHPALERRHDEGNLVVLGGLREFREHLGGELTVTLLRDIGVGEEVHEMNEGEIRKAIAWLKHRLERSMKVGGDSPSDVLHAIFTRAKPGPRCAVIWNAICCP